MYAQEAVTEDQEHKQATVNSSLTKKVCLCLCAVWLG